MPAYSYITAKLIKWLEKQIESKIRSNLTDQ